MTDLCVARDTLTADRASVDYKPSMLCTKYFLGATLSTSLFIPGSVLGAAMALVGSYLVGVQKKHEDVLADLIEDDLVEAWSHPTRQMHDAAQTIQRRARYSWWSVLMFQSFLEQLGSFVLCDIPWHSENVPGNCRRAKVTTTCCAHTTATTL